jgi:mannose-6-phosphate isomerase-like protein (cupin superfamily)
VKKQNASTVDIEKLMPDKRFKIENLKQLPSQNCPCGLAKRAFTEDPEKTATIHLVEISQDARAHYHKRTTEIYYILEGSGQIELDGELFNVEPHMTVMIKPGCRHRAVGKMKILNIPVPAFDPNDEFFDTETDLTEISKCQSE